MKSKSLQSTGTGGKPRGTMVGLSLVMMLLSATATPAQYLRMQFVERLSPSQVTSRDVLYVGDTATLQFVSGVSVPVDTIQVPLQLTFSNGNPIGPLRRGQEFSFASCALQGFEFLNFDSTYGADATDPDTLYWGVQRGDSSGTYCMLLCEFSFPVVDTGWVHADTVSLPSGVGPRFVDTAGQVVPMTWQRDSLYLSYPTLQLEVYASEGDKLVAGKPGRILVRVRTSGVELDSLVMPFVYRFSNGNVIGSLQEGMSVLTGAGADAFETLEWDSSYEDATDPDTTLYTFLASGGAELGTTWSLLWYLDFVPSDTGRIVIDTATLPGGQELYAHAVSGLPVTLQWQPDTICVVPEFRLTFDPITSTGSDTTYVGEPAEIRFNIDPLDWEVQAVVWPVIWRFTNGNLIGPLIEGDNVHFSDKSVAAFESLSFNPFSGVGSDPDTSITGCISFRDPWTGPGTLWSVTFTPADTGAIILDSTYFRLGPALGWPHASSPDANTIPSVYELDTIYVVERPVIFDVSTSTGNDTLLVGRTGSIRFTVDANSHDVYGLAFPMELAYSGGNWIGPLSDDQDGDPLNNVKPSAMAVGTFASRDFDPAFGNGTDPDTLSYVFTGFGGPWTLSGEVFRIDCVPSAEGGLTIDTALLPGVTFGAVDSVGQPLPVSWPRGGRDIVTVTPRVKIYATTSTGSDTIYPGNLTRIDFHLDAQGYEISGVLFPLEWMFSNVNFVGPLHPDSGNVYTGSAASAFESIAWNSSYGQGTNPDTTLYGFTDFGGPYTADAVLWSVEFVATDTGTVSIDTLPPLPPASVGMNVLGPAGNGLPFVWTAPRIVVGPCPVDLMGDVNEDGAINSIDIIYMVNYMFKSGPDPLPERAAGDVNCSGGLSAADIIWLVNYVFRSGPTPCGCFIRRI